MRTRGFYFDREPGFHDLRGGFDAAAKLGGGQKTAKDAALLKVFQKFALLDAQGEPIEAVAKVFAQSNFGYGDDPTKGKLTGDPTFGSSMGMPSETGDRNGLSGQLSYGGV